MNEPTGEVILYRSDDGKSSLQLRAAGGTVWLTQAQLAELYGTSVPNILQIIGRVLADGEVGEATINSELIVRTEGSRDVRRRLNVYNLDMVLAVGYRVTTPRAVQFRQWATTVLKEYLVKGFSLNDARLKDPAATDYFDELLERIRAIRASEKRFYQKVRDIFAATSADYDGASETARTFFATIQNKLLYAVTGHTAAELIEARADAMHPTMGLTTWKGDRVRRGDVSVSKNYLTEEEMSELNRLTTMFLDFAEDRARRRQTTLMTDWLAQADRFLEFNERAVLTDAGRVSTASMERITAERYSHFDNRRRTEEAHQAETEELQDLNELAAVEQHKRSGKGDDARPTQSS
ncbi:virulence RhuM family protein [Georgenia sp. MJ173]|uniref:virulence RhuM family protein n=1 Tax=Georgenia sunbinii TaxID=3117728 RepID=UPI002F261B48